MDGDKRKQSTDKNELEVELAKGQVAVTGNLEMPMKRKFSILSIIAVGYNITNSWVAIAASFAIAIKSGGAVSLLYGIIAVTVAMLCTGLTLAELASVYPTAGGQYHFTSILASRRWSRGLSYFSGLAAVFSWITLGASICIAATQALMAIVIRWQPTYEAKAWHLFLVYELFNAVVVVYNIFLTNKTLWVYNAGCKSTPSHLSPSSPWNQDSHRAYSHPLSSHLHRHHNRLSGPLIHRNQLQRRLVTLCQRLRRLARRYLLPDRAVHATIHALRSRCHPPSRGRVSGAGAHRPQGCRRHRHRRLLHSLSLCHWYHLQFRRRVGIIGHAHWVCPVPSLSTTEKDH